MADRRYNSPVKYRIDLATGETQKVSEREWAGAQPYRLYQDSIIRDFRNTPEPLSYKGKTFARRGAKWPLYPEHATRLSPDASFLAVNSWDGEMKICPELPGGFGCRNHIEGHYYVEIYDTGTAALALTLSGQFHGVDPMDLFRRSAWFSSRYYVLPVDSDSLDRFVLCDVPLAAESGKK